MLYLDCKWCAAAVRDFALYLSFQREPRSCKEITSTQATGSCEGLSVRLRRYFSGLPYRWTSRHMFSLVALVNSAHQAEGMWVQDHRQSWVVWYLLNWFWRATARDQEGEKIFVGYCPLSHWVINRSDSSESDHRHGREGFLGKGWKPRLRALARYWRIMGPLLQPLHGKGNTLKLGRRLWQRMRIACKQKPSWKDDVESQCGINKDGHKLAR